MCVGLGVRGGGGWRWRYIANQLVYEFNCLAAEKLTIFLSSVIK